MENAPMKMSEELWADIQGYEGLYKISSHGRVWSCRKNRCLKDIITNNGYCRVHLVNNGSVKSMAIHRLVAMAFIPNPENKPTVNHKNEDKKDNHVENLEWATIAEQNIHGTRIERAIAHTNWSERKIDYAVVAAKHDYYSMNKKQMRPVVKLDLDGNCIAKYDGIGVAARENNVGVGGIWKCANERRKTCGGFKWKYAESF